jgi:hypothetical protein
MQIAWKPEAGGRGGVAELNTLGGLVDLVAIAQSAQYQEAKALLSVQLSQELLINSLSKFLLFPDFRAAPSFSATKPRVSSILLDTSTHIFTWTVDHFTHKY